MDSADDRKALLEAAENMMQDNVEALDTVIAQGAHFKGMITCPDQLFVLGSMEGDIDCGGMVRIGNKGVVQGNIFARKVILEGAVHGHIKSAEYVEIKPTGRLIGNLNAAKIRLFGGCIFEGASTMQGEG
jgi:cytoskeletal protein CcmA (bactofilin family)